MMANKKNYNKISAENTFVNEEVKPVEEVVEPAVTVGIVSGCKLLNVRSKPNKKSDVVCVIKIDTEVEIDATNSTRDFYKVKSKDFNGYCMKKFITVKA